MFFFFVVHLFCHILKWWLQNQIERIPYAYIQQVILHIKYLYKYITTQVYVLCKKNYTNNIKFYLAHIL